MRWIRIKDGDLDTYNLYSNELMALVEKCIEQGKDEAENDDVQLLQMILKDYDDRHRILSGKELTAPELIRIAMLSHGLTKNIEVAELLGVSESLISQVLNYKKPVSKKLAKTISAKFDVPVEHVLREYPLDGAEIDAVTSILSDKKAQLIARKNQILSKINELSKAAQNIDRLLHDSAA